MLVIGIHSEAQDSGKSFLSIRLADALARQGHRVALVDADDANNGADTSFSILSRRPLRKRGFSYCRLQDWAGEDRDADIAVIDTSRSPANGIKKALREECNIVLIPCTASEKSLQAADDALRSLQSAGVKCAIAPNRIAGDTDIVRQQYRRTHAAILPDIYRDDFVSDLMRSGDLPVDCPAGEEYAAKLSMQAADALAAEILRMIQ